MRLRCIFCQVLGAIFARFSALANAKYHELGSLFARFLSRIHTIAAAIKLIFFCCSFLTM